MSQSRPNTANRLGGQASLFFLGNVFTLLVGFPLQIYVARSLGADSLGIFSLIEGGVGLAAGLMGFGLASALVKFIPTHLELGEYACIRKLVGKGALILLVAGSMAYGVLLLVFPIAARAWPVITDHQAAVTLMGLLIPLGLIAFFLQQGLRGFQEIRYMVLGSSFMQLTVKAVLTVLLLALGFQLMGYIWAVVISVLCACAWLGYGLWKKLSAMPKIRDASCGEQQRAWRNYAGIQYTGSLLGMGAQYLDRFLLGIVVGAAPVGILAVVKQLQQMPGIFLQMFLAVAAPMFSAAHARGDAQERQHIYHLTTDWVMRLSAPLFIFFLLFAEPLLNLYGQEFVHEGLRAFQILLLGQAINLGFGPLGNMLNMSGKEGFMLRLSAYDLVISMASVVILVPSFGLTGAAMAITFSTLVMNFAAMWAARTLLGIRWADRRYLRWIVPFAASIAVGVGASTLGPQEVGVTWLVMYLVLCYGVFHGVSLAQGLHEDDRELLGHIRAKLGLAKGGVA